MLPAEARSISLEYIPGGSTGPTAAPRRGSSRDNPGRRRPAHHPGRDSRRSTAGCSTRARSGRQDALHGRVAARAIDLVLAVADTGERRTCRWTPCRATTNDKPLPSTTKLSERCGVPVPRFGTNDVSSSKRPRKIPRTPEGQAVPQQHAVSCGPPPGAVPRRPVSSKLAVSGIAQKFISRPGRYSSYTSIRGVPARRASPARRRWAGIVQDVWRTRRRGTGGRRRSTSRRR